VDTDIPWPFLHICFPGQTSRPRLISRSIFFFTTPLCPFTFYCFFFSPYGSGRQESSLAAPGFISPVFCLSPSCSEKTHAKFVFRAKRSRLAYRTPTARTCRLPYVFSPYSFSSRISRGLGVMNWNFAVLPPCPDMDPHYPFFPPPATSATPGYPASRFPPSDYLFLSSKNARVFPPPVGPPDVFPQSYHKEGGLRLTTLVPALSRVFFRFVIPTRKTVRSSLMRSLFCRQF